MGPENPGQLVLINCQDREQLGRVSGWDLLLSRVYKQGLRGAHAPAPSAGGDG